jgi:hypothetical protein
MYKCKCPNPRYIGTNKNGTIRYAHQDLSVHNPDLFWSISNPSDFFKNFKDRCIYCKTKIPKDWNYYRTHGNSCSKCSAKFEDKARAMRKHVDLQV